MKAMKNRPKTPPSKKESAPEPKQVQPKPQPKLEPKAEPVYQQPSRPSNIDILKMLKSVSF